MSAHPASPEGEPAAKGEPGPEGKPGPEGEPAQQAEPAKEGSGEGGEPAKPYGEPGRPLTRSPFMIGLSVGFGLLVVYLSYQAVVSAWHILVLVIVAGFFAVGLNPAVVRLQKLGLSRGLAVIVVVLALVLVGCGGLFALIPPVVKESVQLANALPDYVQTLLRSRWISRLNEQYDLVGRAQKTLTPENITTALGGLYGAAAVVFGQLFNILTTGILTLYFLTAFDRLKDGAYRLVPASRRERVRLLGDEILTKVGGYMVGSLLIASMAGLSSLVFMLITGIPYPLPVAILVALFDLIPQIGATLGGVLLTLMGLTVSIPVAIAALVFFLLYQQLENWVIYPRVMGRTTQISDLAAIVGVLIGASLLGVVGVLIAIPATAAIQLIVREVILPRQNTN